MAFSKRLFFLPPIIAVSVIAIITFGNFSVPVYETAPVKSGSIIQEVLATGHVESPSATDLHFKSSGKLVSLRVKVGDHVQAGDLLARQDPGILTAQLAEANATLAQAKAALAKVEAGATPQSVALSESGVSVANSALENKYQGIDATLADVHAKAVDAIRNQLAQFFTNAGTNDPKLSFLVNNSDVETSLLVKLVAINKELDAWKNELSAIPALPTKSELERALISADDHLIHVQAVSVLAVSAVDANIGLSSTNATTYRANASAGLSEVNSSIVAIRSIMQSINSAKALVEQSSASLELTKHAMTQDDKDLARATVNQANAKVASVLAQMRDLDIISPFAGVVTDTTGVVGDVVTPSVPVIALMPETKLDVKAQVAEGNIVGVKVGQRVRMTLDAFPSGMIFGGVVSEIDPAESVIGGAIYYQTTVVFDKDYPDIRSGMTANLNIETGSSTSALLIPASALTYTATSTTVNVLVDKIPNERVVVTGLKSLDGMVEIVSGVNVDDRVIIGAN